MSKVTFRSAKRPFKRWMGPFSPARGKKSGFRFHHMTLGTWVEDETGSSFWPVAPGRAVTKLANLVLDEWGGGRVLLLPNGLVIKPLRDTEVGRRVLIGLLEGPIVLETPDGYYFDLSDPGVAPGDLWPGPKTSGLECAIQSNGSLTATWYHPSQFGRTQSSLALRVPDKTLAAGFRKARPGEIGGRVRLTANGHVITNRKVGSTWQTRYVGYVDGSTLLGEWKSWIKGGS